MYLCLNWIIRLDWDAIPICSWCRVYWSWNVDSIANFGYTVGSCLLLIHMELRMNDAIAFINNGILTKSAITSVHPLCRLRLDQSVEQKGNFWQAIQQQTDYTCKEHSYAIIDMVVSANLLKEYLTIKAVKSSTFVVIFLYCKKVWRNGKSVRGGVDSLQYERFSKCVWI